MAGYTGELLARSASLEMPVMVLWGAEDRLTPADHADAFAKVVPHAQVKMLEHCGHYPQLELPTRVTRLLDEFLSQKRKNGRASPNGASRNGAARRTNGS